ncbi:hypothetical protein [Alistipes sp.]|uniref:hypothetical protein n=1 Tax=Alistipes sp. TaxID=1872444 RepID=UPI003AF002E6
MLQKFNAAFVESVCAHTPDHSNPSQLVTETLHVGREAAYRRLRGEVPFSFGEAAALSSRLNFSLDGAVGSANAGHVDFRLKFTDFESPLTAYSQLLESDVRFFEEIACDQSARIAMATNSIPAEFYLRYENMARFKLYKWLYQHNATDGAVHCFEDFELPERLSRSCRAYVAASQRAPATSYVFDESCFKHWVNAIRAFRAMHLVSGPSSCKLREEMLHMIDQMEHLAGSGELDNGNGVLFYLSGVDIESTYFYIAAKRLKVAGMGLFSLNGLYTGDAAMYDYVQRWIHTQTRFSTLISRSGEMQRIDYFRRQRKIAAELG